MYKPYDIIAKLCILIVVLGAAAMIAYGFTPNRLILFGIVSMAAVAYYVHSYRKYRNDK